MKILDLIDWAQQSGSSHETATVNATLEDIVDRHDRGENACPLEYAL